MSLYPLSAIFLASAASLLSLGATEPAPPPAEVAPLDSAARIKLVSERIDTLSATDRERGGLLRLRGGLYFRTGDWNASAADFDSLAKQFPPVAPQLWERGITLYYLGRYAEGAQQFVDYQTVYNNDVENAVWRYLCQKKVDGKAKAREAILPIAADSRIPMMEVYALFKGTGSVEAIEKAVAQAPTHAAVEARFMADLYLGLWRHAEDDISRARTHIDRAVGAYKDGHYMWSTAVQHQRLLKQTKQPKPAVAP